MSILAAAAEQREAGPIGLVVILCLAVALIFLIRSMNKHLRKVPGGSFSRSGGAPGADGTPADATPDATKADQEPDRTS
jgi:hypothetical protein